MYVMEAGAAHGVSSAAEFTVYEERESPPRNAPLGTLVVHGIGAFSSILDVPFGFARFALNRPAYALQSKTGTEGGLRLFVAADESRTGIFESLAREAQLSGSALPGIVLVDERRAELGTRIEDSHVVFNIFNPLVTKFGLVRMPFRISPTVEDVYPVIRAAVHYHWHLRRTNRKRCFPNKVRMEFMKLKQDDEDFDDDFNLIIRPDGPNLNIGGVVDIVVDQDAIYGINIINETDLSLFPYLFFFDNSDFSICECFA
jgi:hypothetical protein